MSIVKTDKFCFPHGRKWLRDLGLRRTARTRRFCIRDCLKEHGDGRLTGTACSTLTSISPWAKDSIMRLPCQFLRPIALIAVLLTSASGNQPVPTVEQKDTQEAAASGPLKIEESENTITIEQDGQTVVTFNKVSPPAPDGIDKIYERSGCLHPIPSPEGRVVTEMFPADHAHQHGIFSAWVNTTYDGKPVDFWNLPGRTGRVLHERVVSKFNTGDKAGFEVDLLHRAVQEPAVDVLRERWKITVYPTDGTYHCFDVESVQTANTDKPLLINKYHYGGMALRGPTRWLTENDGYARKSPDLAREPSSFVNDLNHSRAKANHAHAKWVALTGQIEGKPASIAVLCHADNFRAPQAARIHPTKPYFCFAPCVDDAFVIDRDHPYKARYRFLVTDAKPDREWLDGQWKSWCQADHNGPSS